MKASAVEPQPPHPLDDPAERRGTHRDPAVDALLECLGLCQQERQRRCLENRVVMLTLDLADSAARRYGGRGVDLEDLTQIARLALVKAVRGYRCGLGHGFAAYAIPTMTGEIKRHFRDHGWAVRPPRRLQEVSARIAQEEPALRQRLQRDPTDAELAGAVGVPGAVLNEARTATLGYHTTSLDGGPADAAPRQVPDERDDIEALLTREALQSAMAHLTPRERDILHMRFVEERTQSDIGRLIGVSQMQVSRLLAGILGRLHTSLTQTDAVA
jgi:RNA polymerase sigma-B factor